MTGLTTILGGPAVLLEVSVSDQAASGWPTALVGFVGVVVGSVLAALFAAHRDRVARRDEAQRVALYDTQEAALSLRVALESYGDSLTPSVEATRKVDQASGRLELLKYRLLCDVTRQRVDDWKALAERFYTGDEAVTAWMEAEAWQRFQQAVGRDLRQMAGGL